VTDSEVEQPDIRNGRKDQRRANGESEQLEQHSSVATERSSAIVLGNIIFLPELGRPQEDPLHVSEGTNDSACESEYASSILKK
ncbi:hypothetical protein M8C21_021228, partial [Ambrosia artemisiifolia]